MKKSRGGFKLGRKVVKIFKWVICPKRKPSRYKRLLNDAEYSSTQDYHCRTIGNNNSTSAMTMMTKIIHKWGQRLKRGAKNLCFLNSSTHPSRDRHRNDHYYRRIDQANDGEAAERKQKLQREVVVPKGHLMVYVKGSGDEEAEEEEQQRRHRFLVPVLYFNHPLFGQLLREAEKEYGFHQAGCITIPCPISEFQNVQARIAACRKLTRKHLL